MDIDDGRTESGGVVSLQLEEELLVACQVELYIDVGGVLGVTEKPDYGFKTLCQSAWRGFPELDVEDLEELGTNSVSYAVADRLVLFKLGLRVHARPEFINGRLRLLGLLLLLVVHVFVIAAFGL